MVSWVITGATRGIGFGYIQNLSADPENQVFALIRSRATAGPLEKLASERKNIHIVETDLSSTSSLDAAAAAISKANGGSLDVLVLNAASSGPETSALTPSAFRGKQVELEREINENMTSIVINNMFVINAFLDLIRAGTEKKIIFISSQSAAIHFTRITGFASVMGYSAAKAAMEMVTAKYAAELAPEGIKTLSLSPGWVDTDAAKSVTGDPEVRKYVISAFRKLDPNVNGPIPVQEAVEAMLNVINGLTEADSGKSVTLRGENGGWF